MEKIYTKWLWLFLSFFLITGLKSQVVSVTNPTNTVPNLNTTYPSLAAAVTAVNGITSISGVVVITLNPSNPQTAPAGGYAINFTAVTSGSSNIIFEGNNNIITAFTPQTSGSITDALIKLIGVDYVTIRNFNLRENSSNTGTVAGSNNMTEWGIALLCSSTTNGAQNNTLLNNTISLNKNYRNTFGIYSNTNHSATAPSSTLSITDAVNGPNSNNKVYGNNISNVNMGICFVGSSVVANMDTRNDIGGTGSSSGNTLSNWGGQSTSSSYVNNSGTSYGIYLNNQKDENVSFNTMVSAVTSGLGITFRGIYKDYNNQPTGSFTSTISNNTISLNSGFTGPSALEGIRCQGITTPLTAATINVNNNKLINNNISASGTSQSFLGIGITCQAGIVNINSNLFRNNSSTSISGINLFTAISNTGAVQTALNINNNQIGDASGVAITCSAAAGGSMIGISCPTVGQTASISISGNNFQGFTQAVAGSGIHNYITVIHSPTGPSTDNFNSNTFTNLVANTSGAVTFIGRTGSMALNAGHTENCSNNSIIGTYSKPVAGGTVALYNSGSSSLAGNTLNHTGNDFSNITLSSSTMNGWNNVDGGATNPTKIISNNIFQNWTVLSGSNPLVVIQCDKGGFNTAVSNNLINNINSPGSVRAINQLASGGSNLTSIENNAISNLNANEGVAYGITAGSTGITTLQISKNKILNLNSNSTATIGIFLNTGTTVNIFQNKIANLTVNNASGNCYAMNISGSAIGAYQIYNNTIGNLFAPISDGSNAITGIIATSVSASCSYDIAYNTIYINAVSTGTSFGSSGIYLAGNSSSGNGSATLRNNIVVNTSVSTGGSITSTIRRNNVQLGNFSGSSDRNLYYAGAPSATNLIFTDGITNNQTLASYKITVGPTRESGSFTEMPSFLSTVATSANFLHLNPAIPTQAESGAVSIAGITIDIDNDIRQGNVGYTGTGSAPDIGADEFEGLYTELNPPVIAYAAMSTPVCSTGDRTLSGVTITDATGVPLTGSTRPRIYYRKNTGSWFSRPGTNTGGNANNSNWSFTIVAADMGTLTGGDQVQYFVVAQDLISTPNVGANASAGFVATDVNNINTVPTTPASYDLLYNLSGSYSIGVGGDFLTLTAASNAYNNACSLSGNILFVLIDDSYPSEAFPVTFNKHPDANSTNTLTIRPSLTSTPVVTGVSSQPLIIFDGAIYVTIDGRQGGSGSGKSLTISNTGTGITVQFINDAKNDAIRYCSIKGQRVSTFSGTIVFATANASGSGNDNNIIANNNISEAGSFSNNAIYSAGTSFRGNDNNIISNNNIYNYYNATNNSNGIYVSSNSSSWTITGNRLYQTTERVYTATSEHYGIFISSGSGYTISGNIIGFSDDTGNGKTLMIGNSVFLPGFPSAYNLSGTPVSIRYLGIGCSFDLFGAPSTINGNQVSGIAMFTSNGNATLNGMFCGIYIESGTALIGNLAANTIGSTTGTNSIYVATTTSGGTVVGIRAACTGSALVQNNKIGGIVASGTAANICAGFTGISVAGNAVFTVSNNDIGNSDVANIRMGYTITGGLLSQNGNLEPTSGTAANFTGISCSATGSSVNIINNSFRGWWVSTTNGNINGIVTSNSMTGVNPSLNISNNFFGTPVTGWLNFLTGNSGALNGILAGSSGISTHFISGNQFQGISYGSGNTNTGANRFILLSGSVNSNHTATISTNIFNTLTLQSSNLTLINTSYSMPATAKRYIIDNTISGTLHINSLGGGGIIMIRLQGNSVGLSQSYIRNNDFSNLLVNATGNYNYTGIEDFEGNNSIIGCPTKRITGNVFSNWSGGKGDQFIMLTGQFGSVSGPAPADSVTANRIENINTEDGFLYGLVLGYINPMDANIVSVSENIIKGLHSQINGGDVAGILLGTTANATSHIEITANRINDLQSDAGIALVAGIMDISQSGLKKIGKNRIYNLSGTGTGSEVNGIRIVSSSEVSVYNNLIADLKAPQSNGSTLPAISGIYLADAITASVYNNTVYLSASGSSTNFSSAAIYSNALSSSNCTNNIFTNLSIPGLTGRSVAFWREDANLSNYSGNYNSYYAGMPSTSRLLFFDGTSAIENLSAFQALVSPRETNSVTGQVSFISTNGSDAGFLHLDPTQNCQLLGRGNNSNYLLPDDVDGESRLIVSPFLTDIGADEVSKTNNWTGSLSSAWNDPGNWSEGIVPNNVLSSASIQSGPSSMPLIGIGDTYQLRYLLLGSGAVLNNHGTLKIDGAIQAPGGAINNFNGGVVAGSIEITGNCNQPFIIAGSHFNSNSVNNLILHTDAGLLPQAGEQLILTGGLSFAAVTGKQFSTADNLILRSSAAGTAWVADLTGNQVTGKVSVERYINTGLVADGRHPKSWQFLSTPAKGQTILQSWQENATAPVGYGTIITGTGSGFDFSTTQPSMKYFDAAVGSAGSWQGVFNTTNQLFEQRGYLLFVRGDRSVINYNAIPNPTVLRAKGSLFQPSDPPPVTNVLAGRLASVGNPYASAIDVSYLRDNGYFNNLNNDIIVWDPLLYGSYGFGGYQTLSAANNYEPTAGGTAYYPSGVPAPLLQSGQAFFVRSSGLAGSISFTEACKASGSRLVNRLQSTVQRSFMRATLHTSKQVIADGNAAVFSGNYRDGIDADDAMKRYNDGENFSLTRMASKLSVEARSIAKAGDTLYYEMKNLRRQTYQFCFAALQFPESAPGAWLHDRYTGHETAISLYDTTWITFQVNDHPSSAASDRFYLVFRENIAPDILLAVTANSLHGNELNWQVKHETGVIYYFVEKSEDGIQFDSIGKIFPKANNGVLCLYNFTDARRQPRDCYYRIRAERTVGESVHSNIVKATVSNNEWSVYPNPVVDQQFFLSAPNESKGIYQLKWNDASGKLSCTQAIQLSGQQSVYKIFIGCSLASGIYHLEIRREGKKISIPVLVK
jgi:hypothetical protein